MPGRYSDDEVQAIFRRALEQQAASQDGFARDELVEAAREVGLDEAAVDRAIKELEAERSEAALVARIRRKKRRGWRPHALSYAAVIGGMALLMLAGFVPAAAVAWTAFGWGIGLAMHTFGAFGAPSEKEIERERRRLDRKARRAAKARARREVRQARRARERARDAERRQRQGRQQRAGDELEAAIEEGVAMLIGAAVKKIRDASEPTPAPDTEFNRYVAQKKRGGQARARGGPAGAPGAPPRARVVETFDEPADEEVEAAERARPRRRGR